MRLVNVAFKTSRDLANSPIENDVRHGTNLQDGGSGVDENLLAVDEALDLLRRFAGIVTP